MAAGTLGRVDEFDGTNDEWLQYVERLEHFFAANGIDDADKKLAVLLTVVGAATYKTLRNIVSPKKPGEKTYVEIVAEHFKPTPSEIVERFKFHSRCRNTATSARHWTTCFEGSTVIGERKRANLVVRTARFFYIIIYNVPVRRPTAHAPALRASFYPKGIS